MEKRRRFVRLFLPVVMLAILACGPCGQLSQEKPTPPRPIAVSAEAAAQLESRIQQGLNGQSGQQFIVRMSDSEVTSLVATQLADLGESPLHDPQIWFTKGKIYGTGRLVNVLPVDADFWIVASAHIEDGQVALVIEDFSAGLLPIPDGLLDTISRSINETVNELQLNADIRALEILEGEAIIQGVRK